VIRRLVVLPEAQDELSSAAEWYESQRTGLGVELMVEVDEALVEIAERPEAWPLWRDDRGYRKRLLGRFPYIVFYELIGLDRLEVVAVAHASRKPGYWLERKS
jgi:plasmid stabilization system protein ParE